MTFEEIISQIHCMHTPHMYILWVWYTGLVYQTRIVFNHIYSIVNFRKWVNYFHRMTRLLLVALLLVRASLKSYIFLTRITSLMCSWSPDLCTPVCTLVSGELLSLNHSMWIRLVPDATEPCTESTTILAVISLVQIICYTTLWCNTSITPVAKVQKFAVSLTH